MVTPEVLAILLTAAGVGGLCAYHVSVARELRQSRKETSRFPMFAVRDELVDLVVDGQMDETDPAWRNLYLGINHALGMHQQLHSVDCLLRYLRRSVEVERNPELKARLHEMRKIEDDAAMARPSFGQARDRAVHAFVHLVNQRTTMWHRTVLLMLFAAAYLLVVSFDVGAKVALRIGRSIRSPNSDALKLWDGPEAVA